MDDDRSVVMVSHDERLREVADRVLWLEDGVFPGARRHGRRSLCAMPVETDGAPSLESDGQMWWFCSEACRNDFAAGHASTD
jgi:putative ABC transport system ATP-binding protein